jgi:hypothetical protein
MIGETGQIPHKYAWMCGVMRQFGNSGPGVPEIGGGGLIHLVPRDRHRRNANLDPSWASKLSSCPLRASTRSCFVRSSRAARSCSSLSLRVTRPAARSYPPPARAAAARGSRTKPAQDRFAHRSSHQAGSPLHRPPGLASDRPTCPRGPAPTCRAFVNG